MKLIVGLGNPGDRYQGTRHNAGFWFVERLAADSHTVLRKDAKFQALVGRHEASGVWLILPQSHMNLSGRPVQMLANFFKIAPGEILVAHDELDFPPGTVRIKQGGGVAGHNGLKDISGRLGTHEYWRLRIGIGHPGDREAVTNYVLGKPAQEDRAAIDTALGNSLEVIPLVLAGDLQGAMLKLHSQPVVERPAQPERPKKPEKPNKPAPERATREPQSAENARGAETAGTTDPESESGGKAGTLGSFFKKFLPDSGPNRKK